MRELQLMRKKKKGFTAGSMVELQSIEKWVDEELEGELKAWADDDAYNEGYADGLDGSSLEGQNENA